ncbi:MAG: hypothetical protein ABI743_14710, partial [bacterium]
MARRLQLFAPLTLTTLGAVAVLATGCSGGHDSAPAIPPDPAVASSSAPAGSNQVPMGIAKLEIDVASGQATITPLRSAGAVGASYALDATGFFTSLPCVDCMEIAGFGRDAAYPNALKVDISLKHPFPDTSKRKDLDVFDPRIIVINAEDPLRSMRTWAATPGVDTDRDGSPETLSGNLDVLINADGYTTHFDKRAEEIAGVSLPGILNPYRNYYTVNPATSGRNSFHRMKMTSPPE